MRSGALVQPSETTQRVADARPLQLNEMAAEAIQYEGYLRREETNAVILGLAKAG